MSLFHFTSEDSQCSSLDDDKVSGDDYIEDYDPLEDVLDDVISSDEKNKFVLIIERNKSLLQPRGQEILVKVCEYRAFRCAKALVQGETSIVVDVNNRAGKMFPIHHAAKDGIPSITEFLLYHGALADARADVSECWGPQGGPKLPLHLPLYKMSRDDSIKEWNPKDSIFMLLASLCRPKFQDTLETVSLLAWNTNNKEILEEIFQYARDGKLEHFAALLIVAHKKLSDSMEAVLKSLLSPCSDAICEENRHTLLLLFDVIVRTGDAIEAYVKQNKCVTIQQTSIEVARLLQEAGFAVKHSDTDLTSCAWFRRQDHVKKEFRDSPAEDHFMPHYGKSGYRWMTFSKPYRPCRKLVDLTKLLRKDRDRDCDFLRDLGLSKVKTTKDDEPISLEDRLDQALFNDDRQGFLSVIHLDRSLFQLKGQKLLEKACEYRALECAEALVKGDTPVVVSINGRTSDKMFPIHHAAKTCHPSITELFLSYGAHADARADVHCVCRQSRLLNCPPQPSFEQRLPLYLTLYKMRCDNAIKFLNLDVYYGHCVFLLLAAICLPRFQNHLETLNLLARSTEDREIEREFSLCAQYVELEHMAALLVVARKRLSDPTETVLKTLYSIDCNAHDRDVKIEQLSLLLKIFARAGDAIEAYVKQGKIGVTVHQTVKDVERLLQEAGFVFHHEDTDFSRCYWFRCQEYSEREWRWKPVDADMPHYDKSGYRWKTYGKPSKPCQIFGTKVLKRSFNKYFHSQARVDTDVKFQVSEADPCVSSSFPSQIGGLTKAMCKVVDEVSYLGPLLNALPYPRGMLTFARRRGIAKHTIVK